MRSEAWLEIANGEAWRSGRPVLRDLNLKLWLGESTTILGPEWCRQEQPGEADRPQPASPSLNRDPPQAVWPEQREPLGPAPEIGVVATGWNSFPNGPGPGGGVERIVRIDATRVRSTAHP